MNGPPTPKMPNWGGIPGQWINHQGPVPATSPAWDVWFHGWVRYLGSGNWHDIAKDVSPNAVEVLCKEHMAKDRDIAEYEVLKEGDIPKPKFESPRRR